MPDEKVRPMDSARHEPAPPRAPRWLHGLAEGPQPPMLFELIDGSQRREARVHDEVRVALGDLSIYVKLDALTQSTASGTVTFLGNAPYPHSDKPRVGDWVTFPLDRILTIF